MRKSAFIRNLLLIAVATALPAGFAGICFGADVPVVSNIAVVDNADGTATVTWDTDIPALGAVNYGPVSLAGTTPFTVTETAAGTSHSVVITGIAPQTNYKIVLVNNEVESPAIYWPPIYPPECPEDVDGLGNVNILDLIFVRNKLGQPVESGDNWKADVNRDGRINVLDMIRVRAKLNTICDP
ncbi:MAG TPA: dockerin type I domain-containing protein [Planctomycetota bacterium]|nr:dockerin type I domain-containing protein [Planctomycetota bacterium]